VSGRQKTLCFCLDRTAVALYKKRRCHKNSTIFFDSQIPFCPFVCYSCLNCVRLFVSFKIVPFSLIVKYYFALLFVLHV
jgi:hypothetical protein